jgi:hypothetical protein
MDPGHRLPLVALVPHRRQNYPNTPPPTRATAISEVRQDLPPTATNGGSSGRPNLGPLGNTIAGALGGAGGGSILSALHRGNLSGVFGDLMYLLEYRDKMIPLADEESRTEEPAATDQQGAVDDGKPRVRNRSDRNVQASSAAAFLQSALAGGAVPVAELEESRSPTPGGRHAKRSPSCASIPSASCYENSVIHTVLPGPTLSVSRIQRACR